MQAAATPPGKPIDTIQPIGTTVYDPKRINTPGMWATTNGGTVLRIKENMIDPGNGIKSHLEKIGVELLGQPLCRIAEYPENALDTNIRRMAEEFAIELGQNPGTEVEFEDEESIKTPGIWTHKFSGMTIRITPQMIENGFLGNLAPKGGLTFVLDSLDYTYDTITAIRRGRRGWQPSARA